MQPLDQHHVGKNLGGLLMSAKADENFAKQVDN
jgi:hypothetical protein